MCKRGAGRAAAHGLGARRTAQPRNRHSTTPTPHPTWAGFFNDSRRRRVVGVAAAGGTVGAAHALAAAAAGALGGRLLGRLLDGVADLQRDGRGGSRRLEEGVHERRRGQLLAEHAGRSPSQQATQRTTARQSGQPATQHQLQASPAHPGGVHPQRGARRRHGAHVPHQRAIRLDRHARLPQVRRDPAGQWQGRDGSGDGQRLQCKEAGQQQPAAAPPAQHGQAAARSQAAPQPPPRSLGGDLGGVHIQGGPLRRDHAVGNKDRIIGDIAAAQIEQPGHLVCGAGRGRQFWPTNCAAAP